MKAIAVSSARLVLTRDYRQRWASTRTASLSKAIDQPAAPGERRWLLLRSEQPVSHDR